MTDTTKAQILDLARKAINTELLALKRMKEPLGDNFADAVEMILSGQGKCIVTGMGKSGLIGRKMAATFASTGTPSFYLHPGEAFHGDLGMISRRNLLGAKGKQVILVDHNEKNQAVAGIENAEILEIIDHHRLGTIQTMSPVFFRNQPLGCTATIIYQMYQEAGIKVEPKIAGLLCSAIVSDTLLFRSPTCTPVDEMAARALADIAGIDIEKYAMEMFSAGSNLKDKSDEEIFYQDFKRFTSGKVTIGVGQITSLNGGELDKLKGRMEAFMEKALENNGLDMIFFMLTNILTETTELICEGQGALQLAGKAFHQDIELLEEEGLKEPVLRLPGVVSRKKQLIPELMLAEQE